MTVIWLWFLLLIQRSGVIWQLPSVSRLQTDRNSVGTPSWEHKAYAVINRLDVPQQTDSYCSTSLAQLDAGPTMDFFHKRMLHFNLLHAVGPATTLQPFPQPGTDAIVLLPDLLLQWEHTKSPHEQLWLFSDLICRVVPASEQLYMDLQDAMEFQLSPQPLPESYNSSFLQWTQWTYADLFCRVVPVLQYFTDLFCGVVPETILQFEMRRMTGQITTFMVPTMQLLVDATDLIGPDLFTQWDFLFQVFSDQFCGVVPDSTIQQSNFYFQCGQGQQLPTRDHFQCTLFATFAWPPLNHCNKTHNASDLLSNVSSRGTVQQFLQFFLTTNCRDFNIQMTPWCSPQVFCSKTPFYHHRTCGGALGTLETFFAKLLAFFPWYNLLQQDTAESDPGTFLVQSCLDLASNFTLEETQWFSIPILHHLTPVPCWFFRNDHSSLCRNKVLYDMVNCPNNHLPPGVQVFSMMMMFCNFYIPYCYAKTNDVPQHQTIVSEAQTSAEHQFSAVSPSIMWILTTLPTHDCVFSVFRRLCPDSHLPCYFSLKCSRDPGPNSGRADQLALKGILLRLLPMDVPFPKPFSNLHGGEGYGFQPWESMGANFTDHSLQHLLEAKIYGQPPIMGSGPVNHPTTMQNMTAIQKRSFKRAYARSLRDGVAWYKGHCMQPIDFPATMSKPRQPCPSRRAGVPPSPCAPISRTHRLNIVQFNVGGLSSYKLEEIKEWGLHIKADLIVLLESRWSFTSQWSDSNWHALHSGTSEDAADGVLVLFNARSIQASQIGSIDLIPGRLVHVRVHYRQRACDLICCYNYMDDRSTKRQTLRQTFWTALDKCISSIPNRNSMLIAGDMNCSLEADAPHVGTTFFTWQGKHHQGPKHRDMHMFQKQLRKHQLTVLNGWNAKDGPTFCHNLTASRIDFFVMRTSEADGLARDVKQLTSADIIPFSGATHIPLMCSVKKFHFSYRSSPGFSGFTYFQRQRCRLDWRTGAPQWDHMLQATGHLLQDLCSQPTPPTDPVQVFHETLGPCFHEFYPQKHRAPKSAQDHHAALIQEKWFYHRQVMQTRALTLQALFHVWKCRSRYAALNRTHKQHTKLLKQQRFYDLLSSVQQAAQHHDSFAVHQIISQYTPKQPKRRIQLRNAVGAPATPHEGLLITKEFVESTWAGPSHVDLGDRAPPGVPFTIQDLEHELHRLPHNRSVAKPFLPAIVVKMHASTIASWLHHLLTHWWSTETPFIPAQWKRAWVTFIPKPNKSPSQVSNLRCIALQEPLGKCVLGALTKNLQLAVGPTLQQWPQYAFLPLRSTGDAIRRVAAHCNEVRS